METTTAKDIMSTELITIQESDTLEIALKMLINNRITGLPVVNKERKMVGVVSEYDILRQISKKPQLNSEIFQEKIEYSPNAYTVTTQTPLTEIVNKFINEKFRRVPVVDLQGRLVGIITRRDLMRIFYYRATLS